MRQYGGVSGPIHLVRYVVPELAQPAGIRQSVESRPVFGCVAMLRPDKGHIHWLRSMPAVLKQCPSARFVVAGEGTERANLGAEAQRLRLARHIEFLGQIEHAALGLVLSQWDAFVLPSPNEPLGIVVVEAMGAGLAVVAIASGGVLDLVCDEATALLVPPGDSAALAAAPLRLAGDGALRASLGRAARQAYERGPFTSEQVGAAIAQLYREALGAATPAHRRQPVPASHP